MRYLPTFKSMDLHLFIVLNGEKVGLPTSSFFHSQAEEHGERILPILRPDRKLCYLMKLGGNEGMLLIKGLSTIGVP